MAQPSTATINLPRAESPEIVTTSDLISQRRISVDSSDRRLPPNVIVFQPADRRQRPPLVADEDQLTPKERKLSRFFKCLVPNCFYTTNSHSLFIKHLADKHNHQRFFCYFCHWETVRTNYQAPNTMEYSDFLTHLVNRHHNRTFQCNKCIFRGYTVDHVYIHQLVDHADQFVDGYANDRSTDQRTNVERCRIIKCKRITRSTVYNVYSYFARYKVHATNKTNHPDQPQLYQCVFCKFLHPEQNNVFLHAVHKHADLPIMIYQPVDTTQEQIITSSGIPSDPVSDDEVKNKVQNSKEKEDNKKVEPKKKSKNPKEKKKEKEDIGRVGSKMKINLAIREELNCLFCKDLTISNNEQKILSHAKFVHNSSEKFACYRCLLVEEEEKPFLGSEAEVKLHNRRKHVSEPTIPSKNELKLISVKFIDTKGEIKKLERMIENEKPKKTKTLKRKREDETKRKKSVEKKCAKTSEASNSDEVTYKSIFYSESSESSDTEPGDLNTFIVPDNVVDKFDPKHNYLKRKKNQAGKEGNVPLPSLNEYIEEENRVKNENKKRKKKRLKSTEKSDKETENDKPENEDQVIDESVKETDDKIINDNSDKTINDFVGECCNQNNKNEDITINDSVEEACNLNNGNEDRIVNDSVEEGCSSLNNHPEQDQEEQIVDEVVYYNDLFKKYESEFNLKRCFVFIKERLDDDKDWNDRNVIRKYMKYDVMVIDPEVASQEDQSDSETDIEMVEVDCDSEEEKQRRNLCLNVEVKEEVEERGAEDVETESVETGNNEAELRLESYGNKTGDSNAEKEASLNDEKESEKEENEQRDSEMKESEEKDNEIKEIEEKDSEMKDSQEKDNEIKENEEKEREMKDNEIKESEQKENEKNEGEQKKISNGEILSQTSDSSDTIDGVAFTNSRPSSVIKISLFSLSLTSDLSYGCGICEQRFAKRNNYEEHHEKEHKKKRKLMVRPPKKSV